MINRDSNNSIIRTNIVNKLVGGKNGRTKKHKRRKNKTLKKGGKLFDSIKDFFIKNPCASEKAILNRIEKKGHYQVLQEIDKYRNKYNELIKKYGKLVNQNCKQSMENMELMRKQGLNSDSKPSIFTKLLGPSEHTITKNIGVFKGGTEFNKKLYDYYSKHTFPVIEKYMKKGGHNIADCSETLEMFTRDKQRAKDQFYTILNEFADKNYRIPLQKANEAYNNCVFEHRNKSGTAQAVDEGVVPSKKPIDDIQSDIKDLMGDVIRNTGYKETEDISNLTTETKREMTHSEYLKKLHEANELRKKAEEEARGLGLMTEKSKDKDQQHWQEFTIDGTKYTKKNINEIKDKQKLNDLKGKIHNIYNTNKDKPESELDKDKNIKTIVKNKDSIIKVIDDKIKTLG